jgi:hypothetical protein
LRLILNDVESVMNRPDRALLHARFAREAVRYLLETRRGQPLLFVDLAVQKVLRAEGTALHILNLPKQAIACYDELQAYYANRQDFGYLKPLLGVAKLKSIAKLSSMTGQDPLSLEHVTLENLDRAAQTQEDYALTAFSLEEAMIRIAVTRSDLVFAARRVQRADQMLGHLQFVGPLHRAIYNKTKAEFIRARYGYTIEWVDTLELAMREIRFAKLTHQEMELQARYGSQLDPVIERL